MNAPQTTLSAQQNFGGSSQMMAVVETASTAIAAQAKAMVESRYIMAMRNPRNMDNSFSAVVCDFKLAADTIFAISSAR